MEAAGERRKGKGEMGKEGGMAEMRKLTSRNTLDTTSTRETTDSGLGYALDVVAEDFAVAFGAAFAETFASFSACWDSLVYDHCIVLEELKGW